MELDVHLTREADEPWGLEFEGGADCGKPLIIIQVEPSSPAAMVDIRPGDHVTRVGDRLASELSRHAVRSYLNEAVGSIALGLCRGLYDPVLDDFEAIYEPVERPDSDRHSEPTEVSPLRCIDFPERPLSELCDDFRPISSSRSLTASPFLPQTKPYRPFSTEPLNVPPLEDPIILNSKFKDDFAEIFEGVDIDKVETKFKLPVSQQYDPNYKKKVDNILEKSMERDEQRDESLEYKVEEVKHKESKVVEFKEVYDGEFREVKEIKEIQNVTQLTEEEVRFDEQMKLDIDMVNIERTAVDVVDESIERAVSVTKEIKEAVEEELRASATREILDEKLESKSEEFTDLKESEITKAVYKEDSKEGVVNESKRSEMKVIEEVSENIEEKPKDLLYVRENKKKIKTHEVKTDMREFVKEEHEENVRESKKEEGKQKAFSIGLQTIPNIKGMAQSSYHFDLLMKTFFIHLTDVMVAMSRFILTQPALELEIKAERVIKDQLIVGLDREAVRRDVQKESYQSQQTKKTNFEVKQESSARKENIESCKVEKHSEVKTQEQIEFEEMERKRLSGAQMAQMTQRKPKELTHKMDAVISEFETKTGIEDRLEVTEQRRSRSRSRIEEEVMNESDPLEWLSKVDSKQEKTSITKESHTESKKMRSEHESRETKSSKSKDGKQMYVAVVESHVYTNKDAILQEMLETSSNESTEEITELNQTEKKQAVEVITQALESVASAESKHEFVDIKESKSETALLTTEENFKTAAVNTTNICLEASQEIIEAKVSKQEATEVKQELFTAVASEATNMVENLEAESFKVAEVSEKKAVTFSEESYKETAIQSTETLLEKSKETTDVKISETHASSKTEQLAISMAESNELVIEDSKVETFEAEEVKSTSAVVTEEETFKTTAIEISEVALEEAVEQHNASIETSYAKITETENLAVAGITETKTLEDKVKIPKIEDEYAALKIIKQEIIEGPEEVTEIVENEVVKKSIEIEKIVSEEKTLYQSEKLHIRTDIAQLAVSQSVDSDENNNIDTPTPATIPPTPLTDEYVFKLQIPLPKNTGVVEDDSFEHEDLSIVKKKLIPHIETTIDETIIYDPPLPTPTEDKIEPVYTKTGLNGGCPVYIKPGLRGGASVPHRRTEYIREIERKSSLLASAIDQTIKSIEEYKEEVGMDRMEGVTEIEEVAEKEDEVRPEDELVGFRVVQFEPDSLPKQNTPVNIPVMPAMKTPEPYRDESGKPIGSVQGIIDGLDEATVDQEIAKELGKPGLTENKIAELISGESEMLREAHVMGLTRVLTSHMSKPDDSSVDFKKIKPLMESLKNSDVIAALNEELLKSKEDKKKEERTWTKFLQKPQRPAPRAKCGYYGFLPQEKNEEGPYKVKIVKQPKPKVAPDYKPENFETGPLPWEQRALTEPVEPPPPLEDPILIPEEGPEFLEAVDPLTESQVPDLQDTGIILPPPKPDTPDTILEPDEPPEEVVEEVKEVEEEPAPEEKEMKGEVEEMAEQLVQNVKNMVDPQAPIQQQLAQMRAQLAALAQLPCVIQQSLEMLTSHLANITQQESVQICESQSQMKTETFEEVELSEERQEYQESSDNEVGHVTIEEIGAPEQNENIIQEVPEAKITLTAEEYAALKREEEMILEEKIKNEKLKKVQEKIEQESRQLKQRAAPRVGKPKMFGPQNPEVRPLVLPGGRRWKGPKDVFNDQFIAETLQAQSEMIQGKAMGFESDRLPYDERINFMKYEKPPVNLDHLQNSDVYKAVHGMEQPMRRVDLLTPVVCEADYRERCRSMTPSKRIEEHLDIPQQLQP